MERNCTKRARHFVEEFQVYFSLQETLAKIIRENCQSTLSISRLTFTQNSRGISHLTGPV